jgi:hypothetical protein
MYKLLSRNTKYKALFYKYFALFQETNSAWREECESRAWWISAQSLSIMPKYPGRRHGLLGCTPACGKYVLYGFIVSGKLGCMLISLKSFSSWPFYKLDQFGSRPACGNKYPQSQFFNTKHIFGELGQWAMCRSSEDWPASFGVNQSRRPGKWMISYSQVWATLPLPRKKLLCNCVFCLIVTLLYIHLWL